MKRKIATLGETDITVHPAAGILLLLGLLTRWRALLICTYASILLHETATRRSARCGIIRRRR